MENKKKTLNIIDAAVILVIVAVIAGAFYRNYAGKLFSAAHTPTQIVYTVTVESVDKKYRNLIKTDDEVFLTESEKSCGTVLLSDFKPSKTYVVGEDALITKYDPAKLDITIKIKSDARKDQNGFFIADSVFIAPGKELKLYTAAMEFSGTVTDVGEISDSQNQNN